MSTNCRENLSLPILIILSIQAESKWSKMKNRRRKRGKRHEHRERLSKEIKIAGEDEAHRKKNY